MPIPSNIIIKNRALPQTPGVYIMKDGRGRALYVGKATSLRDRVKQHFDRPHDNRIEQMTHLARRIDYETTPTVIEALILEANLIKKYQPAYNVLEKDDKSFLYLALTREEYPRVVFVRGYDLARAPRRVYKKVFGPYTNPAALRAAAEILRKIFPWSACTPGARRSCFYAHLGRCPGVCTRAITPAEYGKIVKNLILFFEGKKTMIIRRAKTAMVRASAAGRFEEAAELRNRIFALEHIQDVAVLRREVLPTGRQAALGEGFITVYGRIEGYDISNISGASPVGSMVVFENGEPKKAAYRKFHIKTVVGPNDVAMLREVLERRFSHHVSVKSGKTKRSTLNATRSFKWPLPDIIVIDGGRGQVNTALEALARQGLKIPVVGLAKGFDRKQDVPVYDKNDWELRRVVEMRKELFRHVRDEAHRFAVSFHRKTRFRKFLN